jgi:hypothetical protein
MHPIAKTPRNRLPGAYEAISFWAFGTSMRAWAKHQAMVSLGPLIKPSKLPASWKTPRARCDEYSSKLFPQ